MKIFSSKTALHMLAYTTVFGGYILGMCSIANAAGAKWLPNPNWGGNNPYYYVDQDTCISCGTCLEIPGAFYIDSKNDKAQIWDDTPKEDGRAGAELCPVEAIKWR